MYIFQVGEGGINDNNISEAVLYHLRKRSEKNLLLFILSDNHKASPYNNKIPILPLNPYTARERCISTISIDILKIFFRFVRRKLSSKETKSNSSFSTHIYTYINTQNEPALPHNSIPEQPPGDRNICK